MIVGTSWVFPHPIIHTFLAWQGKKRKKKSGWLLIYAFFGLYGRKEIGWCLITRSPTLKKLNFLSNLWNWANLYSVVNTIFFFVNFLAWHGCR